MRANELLVRAVRLAEVLRAAGFGVGDVIGLSSENRLDFPVVVFAGVLLGATVAPINTTYTKGSQESFCCIVG